MTRVMVDMSATLLHHGHVRLLSSAAKLGTVVVGLTTDEEIARRKGYWPELDFAHRREILLSMSAVTEVVPTPWLISEALLDEHNIDILIHGDDNSNDISPAKLIVLPRTEGVSSSDLRERALGSILQQANRKLMLTPGPAATLLAHSAALRPVFGRGDEDYLSIRSTVENWILGLSGQDELIAMQGSATLGLELAIRAFVSGRTLLVDTGYYASRMARFLINAERVESKDYCGLAEAIGDYDWVVACYTETSRAFRSDIEYLRQHADRLGAKLFLDATASIGLESGHELADAMAFSSCKGLFGITGASFVAYKAGLETGSTNNELFYGLTTQRNHGVTGPYHAICSLYGVIPFHKQLLQRVRNSKQRVIELWGDHVPTRTHQPLLCTYLEANIEALDDNVVLYTPRSNLAGSVICHLGEIWKPEIELEKRIKVTPIHD